MMRRYWDKRKAKMRMEKEWYSRGLRRPFREKNIYIYIYYLFIVNFLISIGLKKKKIRIYEKINSQECEYNIVLLLKN